MKKILIISTLLLALCYCDKQDRENTYINQETRIDAYLSNVDDGYRIVKNKGSYRIVIAEGSAKDSLEVGDSLYFYYSGYTFTSSKGSLFSTNMGEVVRENNITSSDTLPRKILYNKSHLISGLYNGLYHVHEGEVCNILFSAKYGYGNTEMFNVPKLTALFFDIKVEKIVKN